MTQCEVHFSTYLFVQTILTLIVKLYKIFSIKYNLKQNIVVLSSIAHGFLNILTADMVNDLKNARSKKSLKNSNHLPNIFENPLDESSLNPHDTTGICSNPTGITSPPPFYTTRPNRISKTTRFIFLTKRKQYSNQKLNTDQSKSTTLSSLTHYSFVTTNPNDYPLNTSHVDCETDTPVRIYSKTKTSFLRHLFHVTILTFSLLLRSCSLINLSSLTFLLHLNTSSQN